MRRTQERQDLMRRTRFRAEVSTAQPATVDRGVSIPVRPAHPLHSIQQSSLVRGHRANELGLPREQNDSSLIPLHSHIDFLRNFANNR